MNRTGKSLMVLLVAAIGLWGCSQGPSQSAVQAERIKALESKCAKLEDDYKAAAAARDLARKKVSTLEEERAQIDDQTLVMQKEIEAGKIIATERDSLRRQMEVRTTERDMLQTRCEKMKKGLQTLLGQDDAVSTPAQPAAPAVSATGGGL
jgi:predicted RNase H-like nuclease (RuvC/YqgF family)